MLKVESSRPVQVLQSDISPLSRAVRACGPRRTPRLAPAAPCPLRAPRPSGVPVRASFTEAVTDAIVADFRLQALTGLAIGTAVLAAYKPFIPVSPAVLLERAHSAAHKGQKGRALEHLDALAKKAQRAFDAGQMQRAQRCLDVLASYDGPMRVRAAGLARAHGRSDLALQYLDRLSHRGLRSVAATARHLGLDAQFATLFPEGLSAAKAQLLEESGRTEEAAQLRAELESERRRS